MNDISTGTTGRTSTTEAAYAPVRVHIVSDERIPAAAPRARKRPIVMQTVLISGTNPVQLLVNENPRRREVWIIQAGDGEFAVCRSETQANTIGNNTSAAATTSGTPVGVFIPKTAMTAPIPFHTTDPLWAAATTTVTGAGSVRVGVIEILDED